MTEEELRCDHKLHGIMTSPGVIEVACDSKFCGAGRGNVVLHRFDVNSGRLIETLKFKSPHTTRSG